LQNSKLSNRYWTVNRSAAFPLVNTEHRLAIFVRAMPFMLFIAVLAVRRQLPQAAYNSSAFDARWLYTVQVAAALVPLVIWRRRFGELAQVPRSLRSLLLSVVAGLAVFLLWIAPLPAWTHLGATAAAFIPVDASGELRWDLVIARTFGAVLVVPLMEELFWRSFLMRWIDDRDFLRLSPSSITWLAVIASSAVFALAHDLWLIGFVAGVIFATVYRGTGSLWHTITAHATSNLALAFWVVSERAWEFW